MSFRLEKDSIMNGNLRLKALAKAKGLDTGFLKVGKKFNHLICSDNKYLVLIGSERGDNKELISTSTLEDSLTVNGIRFYIYHLNKN